MLSTSTKKTMVRYCTTVRASTREQTSRLLLMVTPGPTFPISFSREISFPTVTAAPAHSRPRLCRRLGELAGKFGERLFHVRNRGPLVFSRTDLPRRGEVRLLRNSRGVCPILSDHCFCLGRVDSSRSSLGFQVRKLWPSRNFQELTYIHAYECVTAYPE